MTDLTLSRDPRPLGSSGLAARPLAWSFRPAIGTSAASAAAAIAAARAAGFGMITVSAFPQAGGAETFGAAEVLLGEALSREPQGDMLLALKLGVLPGPVYDARAESLVAALDASLARLGRSSVDIALLLRPDLLVHPAEIAAAFSTLIRSGRVRAIGVANHSPARIRALLAHLDCPLAVALSPLSILDPAAMTGGLLDLAMERGFAMIASAPLAEGQLGDRPGQEANITARGVLRGLEAIAGQHQVSRAVVAAAFVAVHPAGPIPLFGTQDPHELAGLAAIHEVRFARNQWYRLLEAALGERLPAGEAER